ncbi:MAG: hypothetical protein AAGI44_02970 [Pseudomonadota bacterium]
MKRIPDREIGVGVIIKVSRFEGNTGEVTEATGASLPWPLQYRPAVDRAADN